MAKRSKSGRSNRGPLSPQDVAAAFFGYSSPSDSSGLTDALRSEQPPLYVQAGKRLADLFQGGSHVPQHADPERERVDELRELCRKGNPFPLIAAQWPEFVIRDPVEAAYFEGTIDDPIDPCLRLDYWQRRIIAGMFDEFMREIFVKGCVGAGKGTASSLAINLAFDVWQDCRIVLTSTTFDHAVDTIYAEVVKWREKMIHPGPGRVLAEGIFDTLNHRIMVSNPATGEGFSGKHGEQIIFVFDEASGAREYLYKNALNQFHKILALSNPRTQYGWFRAGFRPCDDENKTQVVQGQYGRRLCVTVSGADCANIRHQRIESAIGPRGGIEITGQMFHEGEPIPPGYWKHAAPLIPNQSDLSRYRGLLADPDPREVDIKAHGKFPKEDITKQVILASWFPFHEQRWHKFIPVECFGLDVAAFTDENVLVAGGKDGIAKIHRFLNEDAFVSRDHTMQVVSWVIRISLQDHGIDLKQGTVPVAVDCDGIGKGVGDRLRELGVWVIEYRGNVSSTVDPRRYANLRAEAYGEFGRRLDGHGPWGLDPFGIPSDPYLIEDLTAPERIFDSSGERFHITPKAWKHGMPEDMLSVKQKIGRSPDTGDAAVMMFHAVCYLGLWSSHQASINQPLVVYPTAATAPTASGRNGDSSTSNGAAANGSASPSANNPAIESQMSDETRRLLDYLRKSDRDYQRDRDS